MKLRKSNLILLFIILAVIWSHAQLNDQQLFSKGLDYYKREQYRDAQKTFFNALKSSPNSRIQTALKLMLAKSYYKLGEYSSSMLVVDDFLRNYPESDYRDDIYFLKGKINFRREKYDQAVESWYWVVQNSRDLRLKNKTTNYLFHTMELYLGGQDLKDLGRKYDDREFRNLTELVQAKKMINSGQVEQGEMVLRDFLSNQPESVFANIARDILRAGRGPGVTSNHILILKSNQAELHDISNAFALGFYYAAREMAQRDRQKVMQIDTLAVESRVLSMLNTTMDALDKFSPLSIVGPLNDDESSSLALLSRYEFFPFISPFNSQKGLAALSPYAFQINPDAEIKGRFLAEYTIEELGAETIAVLVPADAYGISILKGFEDVVNESDAEIVEKQWYYEDTEDFSRQFKAIRSKGFYVSFKDSVLQEDSTLTEEELQEQFKIYLTETLFNSESRRDIDSTQVVSTGIDALFIAIYPEYVPYVAPQFAFQNIETQLLGNEGWNDQELLKQHQVYLDGLIYISAGYLDQESWNYKAFQSRFRQQMQETPGTYHLLGYDIGKWMISHYYPGISRGEYRDGLSNTDLYQGILENIQFGIKSRVNSQLNILKFYRGQFLKLR
ncbi:MAG: ABC transporter substrate-binding protein [Calditrichaeota bacterium]|nr:ABC transporter substrate-binding protein [Calditrichota bacterium]